MRIIRFVVNCGEGRMTLPWSCNSHAILQHCFLDLFACSTCSVTVEAIWCTASDWPNRVTNSSTCWRCKSARKAVDENLLGLIALAPTAAPGYKVSTSEYFLFWKCGFLMCLHCILEGARNSQEYHNWYFQGKLQCTLQDYFPHPVHMKLGNPWCLSMLEAHCDEVQGFVNQCAFRNLCLGISH